MELLQLSYFRVVARLEHMSRAADELHVAQPSLSRAIRRLEDELGVSLFDRQGRGIRLNQFGEAFLKQVERVFRDLDAATTEVHDLAGLEQGVVSVAAGALHWLPELLRPFLIAHPDVRFRLFQRSLVELHHLLEHAEIDFCFVPTALTAAAVQWRHLLTEEISLVVPASHRLAGHASVSLRDLAQDDLVLGKPGDVLREIMDDYFRQAGVAPRIVCEADEPAAVEDFVAAGLGVAFIPGMAKPLPNHDLTVWIRITEPICRLTTGIAWNETRHLSQAARAFCQRVIAHFPPPERTVPLGTPG